MCPRILRPYEMRHTDSRFREWLKRQGLPESVWAPSADEPPADESERDGRK
jgi:hypothetical protein